MCLTRQRSLFLLVDDQEENVIFWIIKFRSNFAAFYSYLMNLLLGSTRTEYTIARDGLYYYYYYYYCYV